MHWQTLGSGFPLVAELFSQLICSQELVRIWIGYRWHSRLAVRQKISGSGIDQSNPIGQLDLLKQKVANECILDFAASAMALRPQSGQPRRRGHRSL
jgi:hypothetical protein